MKLLFLIGAPSVGKMTVGQELAKITPMKLFHLHMVSEPMTKLLGRYSSRAVSGAIRLVLEEYARTENYGLIYPYTWLFDSPGDRQFIRSITDLYRESGAQVAFAELIARRETRLARCRTENRLRCKPSLADVEKAEKELVRLDLNHTLVSRPGQEPDQPWLRLHTDDLTAAETARIIADHFEYDRI